MRLCTACMSLQSSMRLLRCTYHSCAAGRCQTLQVSIAESSQMRAVAMALVSEGECAKALCMRTALACRTCLRLLAPHRNNSIAHSSGRLKTSCAAQLLASGVRVSIAYPPDTNTPGYTAEQKTKARRDSRFQR